MKKRSAKHPGELKRFLKNQRFSSSPDFAKAPVKIHLRDTPETHRTYGGNLRFLLLGLRGNPLGALPHIRPSLSMGSKQSELAHFILLPCPVTWNAWPGEPGLGD